MEEVNSMQLTFRRITLVAVCKMVKQEDRKDVMVGL